MTISPHSWFYSYTERFINMLYVTSPIILSKIKLHVHAANTTDSTTPTCPLQCVHGTCQLNSMVAVCVCDSNYGGQLCQNKQSSGSSWLATKWWTIIVVILGICFLHRIFMSCKRVYERRKEISSENGFIQLDQSNENGINAMVINLSDSDDERSQIELQTKKPNR